MILQQRRMVLIGGGAALVLVFLILIYINLPSRVQNGAPVSLLFWGTQDEIAFRNIINDYTLSNPNVKITYQKFDENSYYSALVNALAGGRGPDVMMIKNRWLLQSQDKLVALGPDMLPLSEVRSLFPETVEHDFMLDGNTYALPLSIDTLALFYNKNFFDTAGIVTPPRTWQEFQSLVPPLRVIDQSGQIQRAAAAIGASEKTVAHGVDILGLLMMQNGAAMTNDPPTQATFGSTEGGKAFNFYLQFANAGSSAYTWNDNQPSSIQSFSAGKTAMIFGYQADIAKIKSVNPFLNMRVAPVPQPLGSESSISYPLYWGFAVSKQSPAQAAAWGFIKFMTTKPEEAIKYLNTTKEIPALLSLVQQEMSDADNGVFARQALTARSWHIPQEDGVRDVFNRAITSVLSGGVSSNDALRQAESQTSQLFTQ